MAWVAIQLDSGQYAPYNTETGEIDYSFAVVDQNAAAQRADEYNRNAGGGWQSIGPVPASPLPASAAPSGFDAREADIRLREMNQEYLNRRLELVDVPATANQKHQTALQGALGYMNSLGYAVDPVAFTQYLYGNTAMASALPPASTGGLGGGPVPGYSTDQDPSGGGALGRYPGGAAQPTDPLLQALQQGVFKSRVDTNMTGEQITARAREVMAGRPRTDRGAQQDLWNLSDQLFGRMAEWVTPEQALRFAEARPDIGRYMWSGAEGPNGFNGRIFDWFPGGAVDTDALNILLGIIREDEGKPLSQLQPQSAQYNPKDVIPNALLAMLGIKERMISESGGQEGSRDLPPTRFLLERMNNNARQGYVDPLMTWAQKALSADPQHVGAQAPPASALQVPAVPTTPGQATAQPGPGLGGAGGSAAGTGGGPITGPMPQPGGLPFMTGTPTLERQRFEAERQDALSKLMSQPRDLVQGLLMTAMRGQQLPPQTAFGQAGLGQPGPITGPMPQPSTQFPTGIGQAQPNLTWNPQTQQWSGPPQQQVSQYLQQTPFYQSLVGGQPTATQPGAQLPFIGGHQLPVRETLAADPSQLALIQGLASFAGRDPADFFNRFQQALPQGQRAPLTRMV